MARIKYYYDTEACKYERIKVNTWDVTLNLLGFLSVAFVIALGILIVYNIYFDSPKEALLKKENQELQAYYGILETELNKMSQMMEVLQQRDDGVYRVIFEAEPIPNSVRQAGVGGAIRYKDILDKKLDNQKLIISTFDKTDLLKKQMYIQTKSYDEVLELVGNKEKMWASIPAIQPVSNKELIKLASGYGKRFHPIHKVWRFHQGLDFSAERGTPIYATGDGKVISAKTSLAGYGKQVEIDHGYGYVTKYAHMSTFNVKVGQRVKRGEHIGNVGSTGTSTAPHLHYEIIKDGKKINPVHFLYQDLTPEEYEKILELASRENQSLGGSL